MIEKHVERNFREHLLPLAGKGPHICLHLGCTNIEHAEWLCRNVLTAVDDVWFGADDFSGANGLFKRAVDAMACFTHARIWPMGAQQFLWQLPPMVGAMMRTGATMIYLDGSRDHAVAREVLALAWQNLRPGGTCIINGYRTGRGRRELYPMVDAFFADSIAPEAWRPLLANRQFGARKVCR